MNMAGTDENWEKGQMIYMDMNTDMENFVTRDDFTLLSSGIIIVTVLL